MDYLPHLSVGSISKPAMYMYHDVTPISIGTKITAAEFKENGPFGRTVRDSGNWIAFRAHAYTQINELIKDNTFECIYFQIHKEVIPNALVQYISTLEKRECDYLVTNICDRCHISVQERDAEIATEASRLILEPPQEPIILVNHKGFAQIRNFYFQYLPIPPSEMTSIAPWLDDPNLCRVNSSSAVIKAVLDYSERFVNARATLSELYNTIITKALHPIFRTNRT